MNTENINIRLAIGKDAKDIHKCNKLSLPVVYDARDYVLYILDKTHYTSVITVNEKVVGYLLARRETFRQTLKGHIMSFAIIEEYRSKGLGKKILDYSCEEIRNKFNVDNITLNVMVSNKRAVGFYKREGFRKFQKLPKYYGKKKHGLMMLKKYEKKIRIDDILTDNLEDYFIKK